MGRNVTKVILTLCICLIFATSYVFANQEFTMIHGNIDGVDCFIVDGITYTQSGGKYVANENVEVEYLDNVSYSIYSSDGTQLGLIVLERHGKGNIEDNKHGTDHYWIVSFLPYDKIDEPLTPPSDDTEDVGEPSEDDGDEIVEDDTTTPEGVVDEEDNSKEIITPTDNESDNIPNDDRVNKDIVNTSDVSPLALNVIALVTAFVLMYFLYRRK